MKQITIILFLIFSFNGFAQDNGENRLGTWHMYFGTNKVSEKLSIHTEAQVRYFEQAKNFNQLLLRTGLNYHIGPNAIATFGYGFIETDGTFIDTGTRNSIEHRIFEQFILKNTVGQFKFEHRYRLEQRFIRFPNNLREFGDPQNRTEHRARYRLQITLPLTDLFFLNFYDEVFINLQNEVFGQNRLYGALGFNVFKDVSLQVGYLKNHFRSAHYDRLQVAVIFNTDLRKKSKE